MDHLRYGAIISRSTKSKGNLRSSTEAELNAVDEKLRKIISMKNLLSIRASRLS